MQDTARQYAAEYAIENATGDSPMAEAMVLLNRHLEATEKEWEALRERLGPYLAPEAPTPEDTSIRAVPAGRSPAVAELFEFVQRLAMFRDRIGKVRSRIEL